MSITISKARNRLEVQPHRPSELVIITTVYNPADKLVTVSIDNCGMKDALVVMANGCGIVSNYEVKGLIVSGSEQEEKVDPVTMEVSVA